ncbi:GntR family transcriptional regulator (plasmid) [Roseomonas sp. CCTCC AB2023176]|uniref:GntR family transcriptional regulator n=1 Tax=Roseomonas sp. CCTCC AB2023176 TaxID=3342640 RepID=UPI0035D7BC20
MHQAQSRQAVTDVQGRFLRPVSPGLGWYGIPNGPSWQGNSSLWSRWHAIGSTILSQAITRAYEAIQSGILSGRFRPGMRLVERDLAADLGISRTPVREALRQLEADGFVQHRPNAGVAVSLLTEQSMSDLGDLRAHLASMCGRLAARRLDADGRAAVAERCRAVHVYVGRHAAEDFVVTEAFRLVRDAHALLFDLCGNDWLASAFHRTTFGMVMQASYMDATADEWSAIAGYFRTLPEALASGDEALTASLMEAYFRGARHRLLRAHRRGVTVSGVPAERKGSR